jgi:hypothetical protein
MENASPCRSLERKQCKRIPKRKKLAYRTRQTIISANHATRPRQICQYLLPSIHRDVYEQQQQQQQQQQDSDEKATPQPAFTQ